eukprot:scaffold3026_cov221-Pinguiococcus_pyrenoidosus.AAC.13
MRANAHDVRKHRNVTSRSIKRNFREDFPKQPRESSENAMTTGTPRSALLLIWASPTALLRSVSPGCPPGRQGLRRPWQQRRQPVQTCKQPWLPGCERWSVWTPCRLQRQALPPVPSPQVAGRWRGRPST